MAKVQKIDWTYCDRDLIIFSFGHHSKKFHHQGQMILQVGDNI